MLSTRLLTQSDEYQNGRDLFCPVYSPRLCPNCAIVQSALESTDAQPVPTSRRTPTCDCANTTNGACQQLWVGVDLNRKRIERNIHEQIFDARIYQSGGGQGR